MATLRERKREETRVDANASAAGEAAAPTARLGALDTHLLAEGRHWRSWQQLGAHAESRGGGGARFAVWAPNARRVSAIGDWNGWDGRANPLRRRDDCGVWEGRFPIVAMGRDYWQRMLDFISETIFREGAAEEGEVGGFLVTDSVEEASDHIDRVVRQPAERAT